MGIKLILSALLVCATLMLLASAEPVEDKFVLLNFIRYLRHSRSLNWDERTSACSSWIGITCNHDSSRVIAVRLPSVGFKGRVPRNTLGRLSALQILSLSSNGISGPFPSDILKLRCLSGLYLESNDFEGPLPLDLSVWENLKELNLSNNRFNGRIPSSISNLTHLVALDLANNSLSGNVPDLNIQTLQVLDLSNNNLTVNVPQYLERFPSSAFSGNNLALKPSSDSSPKPTQNTHSLKFSQSAILAIVIGSSVAGFVAIALLLVVTNRWKKGSESGALQKTEKSARRTSSQHMEEGDGGMIFFEDCNLVFDLEDLLTASGEVLGKGTFGTTYKAALEDATTVAVKRLKEVVVGRKDFEQQMEVVGNIRHPNVAPLRAYYYSKDERLMVYDFYNQGSVSMLLHAKRGENRSPLDWETRLKIGIGAARGIAHIHSLCGGKLVHGNIKSSNIFLNSQHYGCVSDLGLATLTNPASGPMVRSGYRAPEVTDTRKALQASDVYGYGVFLLELLTGKSPVHTTGGEEVTHLVRWVNSVVWEEWTGEVFDLELLRYPNVEEEMLSMLQIGLSCVARMPEERPKMVQVVKMVEEIRVVATRNSSRGGTRSSSPNITPRANEMGSSSSTN
ncbi:putative inactive receptor kinase isoform X2 [Salvia divinorum]|uniref:Inactive receptor kinase isoform X2 n=1 Tax=Salvia divinorum TaxID=28513 RepID=A0ABD1H8K8_SALDI